MIDIIQFIIFVKYIQKNNKYLHEISKFIVSI